MATGFFDITPVELSYLGGELAVAVIRDVLCAEALNLGIPITGVDVPYDINVSDGGVDAVVKGTPTRPGNGIIFAPRTSYQIKVGAFGLTSTAKGKIEELLIQPKAIAARVAKKVPPSGSAHTVGDLSPRVRECLDNGGTFVIALFGDRSIVDSTEDDATETAIRSFLTEIDGKYATAQIKVWRPSRICVLLKQFPAVSLGIKNLPDFQLLSFDRWATRPEMRQEFVPAANREEIMATIRGTLRDDAQGTIHLRMIGEPGVGKTRLVLEALRVEDLKSLVLYADGPTKVDGSVMAAIYSASHARIILVVDECSAERRSKFASDFGSLDARFKIITIYTDLDDNDNAREFRLLDVPRLPDEEIKAILKTYGVNEADVANWASLCEGSPRVAHVIGDNLRSNPADPLKSDGISQIWVKYLAGDVGQETEEYRKRHLVVSSLALFKRFGRGPPVREQAYEIYDKIVRELDGGISKAEFGSIIEQMVSRKVFQGDNFLYITPRAFHIKLWIDWWNRHGAAIDMNVLVPGLSPQLRQWFAEMIEYADATQISKSLVAKWLGPQGFYANADWLNTREGARFFFSLSLANPSGAVNMLERVIGKMSREELLTFEEGRRDVIWALEGTALYSDLFLPSARVLLALAEAENERWTNNASGVFAGLFSLTYGVVAPTSLEPEYRIPVLLTALEAGGRRAKLALDAFDEAVSLQSVAKLNNDQPFRLKGQVKRWLPKTYDELWAAQHLYWQTLRDEARRLPPELKKRAIGIMLTHARQRLGVPALSGEVLDTLKEVATYPDFDKREIIDAIETVLNYDRQALPKELADALVGLLNDLVGTTYESRILRYVGMDLLHDHFDAEAGERDKTAADIEALAQESLANPEKFESQLPWLLTDEAKNAFRFSYALGRIDANMKLWPSIRQAWYQSGKFGQDFFVGGYLRAVFERSPAAWEATIDALASDDRKAADIPPVVWRSGMTDRIAALLLDLAKRGLTEPRDFGLFSMGRTSDPLSDQRFGEWLDFLISVGDFRAASTALNLASMGMHGSRKLTADQIEKILVQPALFAKEDGHNDVMLSHYWMHLARALIKLKPEGELFVLRLLLENIGNSESITHQLGPEGDRWLDELVQHHPSETWDIVSAFIEPPMDTRGFLITRWLRGDDGFHGRNPGPMRHVSRDKVWEWIDANKETRAPYVASMAPKDFTPASWQDGLIRQILCRYGDLEVVQSAVFSNFFTGGWSGPASAHFALLRDELNQLKAAEKNPYALRWLNNAIASVEQSEQSAKVDEEARGF